MKKLFSLLAVAAIVTGAFAFKAKTVGNTFCVLKATQDGCELKPNLQIINDGQPNTQYFAAYINEIQTPCAQAECTDPVHLEGN